LREAAPILKYPLLKNDRPISLISIVGKVMERCAYKHIYNFLLENRIISSNQSGFTPGDSAINQLLYITNKFGKALDDGKEVSKHSASQSNNRL
jgi:hypothetical protein